MSNEDDRHSMLSMESFQGGRKSSASMSFDRARSSSYSAFSQISGVSGISEDSRGSATSSDAYSRRANLVKEILSTERTYVDNLNAMVSMENNLKKIATKFEPIISEDDTRKIFRNIGMIGNFHKPFLVDLTKRISGWTDDYTIGDIFVKYAPFLKIYTQYSEGFEQATSLVDALRQDNKKFQKFCMESKKDLGSLLITPIQRLPRYQMLLESLVKHTPDGHSDQVLLKKAVDLIVQATFRINEATGAEDNLKKMLDIEGRFVNEISLVSPGRTLLRTGSLTLRGKTSIPIEMLLFNDLLIVAKDKRKKLKKIAKVNIDVTFHVDNVPDTMTVANRVFIWNREKSFSITCASKYEKTEWLKDFRKCEHESQRRIKLGKTKSTLAPIKEFCFSCGDFHSLLPCQVCHMAVCSRCASQDIVCRPCQRVREYTCSSDIRYSRDMTLKEIADTFNTGSPARGSAEAEVDLLRRVISESISSYSSNI
eukprot:444140_1